MTQERLKEIAEAAADAINTPTIRPPSQGRLLQIVSCVPKLLAHISPLESELQQVKVERDGLREACERIERWFGEFPEVPDHNQNGELNGRMISYGYAYGSNGERDFMRSIARAALTPAPVVRKETE